MGDPQPAERDPREWLIPAWRKDPEFRPWRSPVKPWDQCSSKRKAALRLAWQRGDLAYKLNPEQRRVYDEFQRWREDPKRGRYFVLDLPRRFGKTYLELLIAIEGAIRGEPGDRNAYWTDTQVMAVKIVRPVFLQLISDCPPDLRPQWIASQKLWRWPGGHELEICGLDDPDAARGRHLDRGNVDEAGFINNLQYVLDSVVDDQMQNRDGSYVIVSSTPPQSPEHYFSKHLVPLHRAEGSYVHRTVYDNPMLSTAEIEAMIKRRGGIHSVSVRREMLAEHLTDPDKAAFPEYERNRHEIFVRLPTPPEYRYCFVALDPGWKDGTGLLFAYWDFRTQRLCVEAEWYGYQARAGTIANIVRDTEAKLWRNAKRWDWSKRSVLEGCYRRWTDIDHRLIADLAADHDLIFAPTEKDNFAQQVVRVREWLDEGKLLISSDCKQLDAQLRGCVYKNDNRREFARSADNGHYDLAAALIYLVRNVNHYTGRNPRPPGLHGVDSSKQFVSWSARKEHRDVNTSKSQKAHRPRLPAHRPGRIKTRS